jgi:hypothetical protein
MGLSMLEGPRKDAAVGGIYGSLKHKQKFIVNGQPEKPE